MLKKAFFIVVLSILLFDPVMAGTTLDLDFEVKDEYILWLDQGDRLLFEWGGFNHTIIMDEVKTNAVNLDIFLFLEGQEASTPQYLTITDRASARVDFDKDQVDDLGIELLSLESDNKKSQIRYIILLYYSFG